MTQKRISPRRVLPLCALLFAVAACSSSGDDAARTDSPPDAALAERGAALFKERGCVACHTIGGGRLVGPDLDGVHERRDYAWFTAMVMNPDSMIREDPDARALYAEYATPMSNMNVTAEEIAPLWDHIRMQSQSSP